MSIQDRGGPISYSDHDVHHVLHSLGWRSNADSGPTDSFEDVRRFEITERGLDPDELAELRVMRVNVSMFQSTTVNQGNPGSVIAEIDAGYNLSGDEVLQSGLSSESIDTDSSGTNDFIATFNDTDEVGQLYHAKEDHDLSFNSTGDSVGGGAGDDMTSELINMSELFGSGPFVDSADDFVSRIKLEVNDVLESVRCNVMYSLYYDVDQVEGGRSRFGR